MPLPMVHLAIAVQAHLLSGHTLTPEFALGSLAPDAIHMRPNTTRADKKRVHLFSSSSSEPETLQCIRLLMVQSRAGQEEPDQFIQGYAAHLLVDYWWVQRIFGPFAEQLPPDTSLEARRHWYYRETDQVDFNLYRQAPWRKSVWDLLASAQAPDFPPFLSSDEIDRWRHRTLDWFEKLKQEPGIVPEIITDQVVADFIEGAAQSIFSYLR